MQLIFCYCVLSNPRVTCPNYENESLNVSPVAVCLFFLFPLSKPVLRKVMFLLVFLLTLVI